MSHRFFMRPRAATLAILFIALLYQNLARAQGNATTLMVELRNVVEYQVDTSDFSKWGTNPNVTPGSIGKGTGVGCVGVPLIAYGDIVSINGQPARGTYSSRGVAVCTNPTPTDSAHAIADTTWASIRYETYEILESDGVTPVGSIMVNGLHSSRHPTQPQSLSSIKNFNRGCTNCHSYIHGSNHPSGNAFLR